MYKQLEMSFERWLPIAGYEGWYEVSDQGRVRRIAPGRSTEINHVLTASPNNHGYCVLRLFKHGKFKTCSMHVLVASHFIGERPAGHEINHIDGNRSNNRLSNLEYVTVSQNRYHALDVLGGRERVARGSQRWNARLTEADVEYIREQVGSGKTRQAEIARRYGVSDSAIYCIMKGKTWKHAA